ncbi:MAG: CoA-binding protein [Gammaproteobacteria bacterium]|nr:CoA-binding protein [Gammaproteobacteria bacterium]MYD76590.1 CoA-binding protein [Gammaproteobacteria bacterium]MYJ51784.1 CoA-binding protein [Gammaproteobacteria bacterium]
MADTNEIRRIFLENRTVAMVGLSANWYRPSFFAAKYLVDHGYRVIPVNPNYKEVLGETCYPDLASIPDKIDVVDLFQKAETTPEYARQAVSIGARVLWLQLGITNSEAERIAREAGMDYVEDRCMKIEHSRIFGGLNFVGVNTGIISSTRNKTIAN